MRTARILLVLLVQITVYPTAFVVAENEESSKPIMMGEWSGWWQKVTDKSTTILRTDDGGQHWRDVTPPALAHAVEKKHPASSEDLPVADLAALNSEEAWVAMSEDPDNDQDTVLIEHTSDGGKTWR